MVPVLVTPVRLVQKAPLSSLRTVVYALALREALLKAGTYKLGLLWALVEPALYVAVHLVVLQAAAGLAPRSANLLAYIFLGVMPFLTLRSMLERGASTLEGGQALMTYRQVTPFALLLARTGLEALTLSVVGLVGLIAISMVYVLPWPSPATAMMAYGGLLLLSFGLANCAAVLAAFYPATRKFLGVLTRALYLVSGVIVPLSVLSPELGAYFKWNPLLHAIELLREAVLGGASVEDVSLQYLWTCALAFVFVGLATTQIFRRELEPA